MRSVKSRSFLYFRNDGRVTKGLHSHRGRGVKSLGGPSEDLFNKVSGLIPDDVLEREDVIQIICMSILGGSLTWRQFAENKAAVLREAKRIMIYSGMLADIALVPLNKPVEPDGETELGEIAL